MTDVLGICTSWDDAGLHGAAGVRAGGPDPAGRHRHREAGPAAGVGAAAGRRRGTRRSAAFALFPDLETEPLGDWVLRRSPTATARRANSVLAFGPSGVADDVDAVIAHYERPIAAVLPDSAEERLFRDRGWDLESTDADTSFQIAGTATALRALPARHRSRSRSTTPPGARRRGSATGRAATPAATATGSASAASGSSPRPAPLRPRRSPSSARSSTGAPPRAPPRRTSRCWRDNTAGAVALRAARLPRAPPLPLPRPRRVGRLTGWTTVGGWIPVGYCSPEVRSGLAVFGDRMWNELRECALCGAAFVDAGKHQRFHDDLDAWIQLIEHELDAKHPPAAARARPYPLRVLTPPAAVLPSEVERLGHSPT